MTTRHARLACGFALLAALAGAAAPAPVRSQTVSPPDSMRAAPLDRWRWRGSIAGGGTLDIRLVRATVRARTGRGRDFVVTVAKEGVRSDPRTVRLVADTTPGGVRIEDRYPRSLAAPPGECLPPDGGRGDFWRSDVRFDVTVVVPRGRRLRVHVMDGDVDLRGLADSPAAATLTPRTRP